MNKKQCLRRLVKRVALFEAKHNMIIRPLYLYHIEKAIEKLSAKFRKQHSHKSNFERRYPKGDN